MPARTSRSAANALKNERGPNARPHRRYLRPESAEMPELCQLKQECSDWMTMGCKSMLPCAIAPPAPPTGE